MPRTGERKPRKGRGAVSNPAGRFERFRVVPPEDDAPPPDEELPRLPTVITPEATRNLLARNDSPDVPFDVSINPYKGCEHGCVYCFARPTHAYLGFSPGLDFETRIVSKPDAPAVLARELAKASYRCTVIALGANTDPYQPAERDLGITRSILEVLAAHRHPVSVVTKSSLILRDLDLLAPMARQGLAHVFVSVTTLDRELARRMEPRATAPERRIEAVAALTGEGIPVGVLASPMIPALNDAELERILEASAAAGARWANYILIRLPREVKEIFVSWLEAHFPTRAAHVVSLIRQAHGGRLYDPGFGERMRGSGPYAELLRKRFEVACRRLGLNETRPALDTTQFRVAPRAGEQGKLFS